ncbi:hypothetical protein DRO03_04225 [Methanosarcinales archaeon]|nr:MAG: hypothetical protein DRO03_04225 [Methanosarcinales archaeon]
MYLFRYPKIGKQIDTVQGGFVTLEKDFYLIWISESTITSASPHVSACRSLWRHIALEHPCRRMR